MKREQSISENYIIRNFMFCLLTQYSSSENSRRIRWVWHVALMGERRDVCRVFVGKPDWKLPIGYPSVEER